MKAIQASEIQTRTSPFGHYATHAPCEGVDGHSAVLTVRFHATAREAYDAALRVLQLGTHSCPKEGNA